MSTSGSKPREVYLPIHVIQCNKKSNCPYYVLERLERESEEVCMARCRVLERYLTRSFVKKCIEYWETCPYKQFADAQQS